MGWPKEYLKVFSEVGVGILKDLIRDRLEYWIKVETFVYFRIEL